MGRPTVHDIAREAGVSLATVDRVLNARPGVRQATIARVQAAVDELGYVRDTFAANLAKGREYPPFVTSPGPSRFASTAACGGRPRDSASSLADRVVKMQIISTPCRTPPSRGRCRASTVGGSTASRLWRRRRRRCVTRSRQSANIGCA